MDDAPNIDALGPRAKIGMVVPSTNTVVQPESEVLSPHGVTNHVGRIPIKQRKLDKAEDFLSHIEDMRSGILPALEQVATCAPDALIMGVALEAFWGGVHAATRFEQDIFEKFEIPVAMGASSMVAALRAFGARRIAVLTPHQPMGDDMVRRYFEESDLTITALLGLKCSTPRDIAFVPETRIRDAFAELDGPDVEAIVQVGTNLAGARIASAAERWLQKPVLSINVVTYWHVLRQLGIEDRHYGAGLIMERY